MRVSDMRGTVVPRSRSLSSGARSRDPLARPGYGCHAPRVESRQAAPCNFRLLTISCNTSNRPGPLLPGRWR